jgi:PPK2 family polyphosphate:nucleotide phosphotransferase
MVEIPAKRFRIDNPENFRLAKIDPADACGLDLDKAEAKAILASDIERLADLQQRLYAADSWAILIVLQAMDAAGKDGVIKHVMSGLNPQGCEVHPFKVPSSDELDHDFLWRAAQRLPSRGRIGIFNRSHYEEVLVARVHADVLARERLPPYLLHKKIWKRRYKSIRGFERHLARNGTVVLKFFLHISKEEQKRRFLARLEEPGKQWKFSMSDFAERKLWDQYMAAYEDAIRETSRPTAPWYVVPADHKPIARLLVAKAIIDALEELNLEFPKVEGAQLKELEQMHQELLAKKS